MRIIKANKIKGENRGGYITKPMGTFLFKNPPENVGFYITTIPKGNQNKPQFHNKLCEILFFITGGKAKLNSRTHEFEPGDIVILEPEETHSLISEKEEVKVLALKFPNIIEDKVTLKE